MRVALRLGRRLTLQNSRDGVASTLYLLSGGFFA